MIFSIQCYIEDHFVNRGFKDTDQYAVKLANLYDQYRDPQGSTEEFLSRVRRIRTAFFANNNLERRSIETKLAKRLDRQFLKKRATNPVDRFPGDVRYEKQFLRNRPRTIARILSEFRKAVEARAVDTFWDSRRADRLCSKPEQHGQALLAVFMRGVLDGRGVSFREVASGIGFVDIIAILSATPHLIELKVLRGKLAGASQLNEYMRSENRPVGWLVCFDARPAAKHFTDDVPKSLTVPEGKINVVLVDINPVPPSSQD